MRPGLRVALDTNVIISAVLALSSSLTAIWHMEDIEVLISQFVIEEASRHLTHPEQRARLWRAIYTSHVIPDGQEIEAQELSLLPEKDRPVLQAALAAKAHLLVTGDYRHFRPLFGKMVDETMILSTSAFKSRFPGTFQPPPEMQ